MKYFILISIFLFGCSLSPKSDVVCTMTWENGKDTTYSCTGKDITKGLSDRKYKEFLQDLEDQKNDEKKRQEEIYKRKHNQDRFHI